jgi:hypothetical protein
LGVVAVFPPLRICAITGADIPKIPPIIANVVSTATAALSVVFINHRKDTMNLKDL